MISQIHIENVVGIIKDMSEHGKVLKQFFSDLREIILQEHEAIKAHQIDAVEELTRQKLEVGQLIENKVQILQQRSENFRDIYTRYFPDAESVGQIQLSQVTIWLETFLEQCPEMLQKNNLRQVTKEFKNTVTDLLQKRTEVQPKIEMNSYLTKKLLNRQRELIRFWQDVANEAAMTYGASGETKGQTTSTSVLRVKA